MHSPAPSLGFLAHSTWSRLGAPAHTFQCLVGFGSVALSWLLYHLCDLELCSAEHLCSVHGVKLEETVMLTFVCSCCRTPQRPQRHPFHVSLCCARVRHRAWPLCLFPNTQRACWGTRQPGCRGRWARLHTLQDGQAEVCSVLERTKAVSGWRWWNWFYWVNSYSAA